MRQWEIGDGLCRNRAENIVLPRYCPKMPQKFKFLMCDAKDHNHLWSALVSLTKSCHRIRINLVSNTVRCTGSSFVTNMLEPSFTTTTNHKGEWYSADALQSWSAGSKSFNMDQLKSDTLSKYRWFVHFKK
jgi:hypothetical protein